MVHVSTNTDAWSWTCVGIHQGPAFLGPWQARAYVAEQPKGWYASAEGEKRGPEYTYRLPGRNLPLGPYTQEQAESIARQMIGLAPDASPPPPDLLVLYRAPTLAGRDGRDAKDVTGRLWTLSTGGPANPCSICGELITVGWSQGRWRDAHHHICPDHVELHNEARPVDC